MKAKLFLPGMLLTGILSANLNAIPLSGMFNIGGIITVTQAGLITWTTQDPPITADKTPISGGNGSFTTLNGTNATIRDLNKITEPVGGAGFAPQLFISFDSGPTLPTLNINNIFQGFFGPAGCLAPTPAAGQTCTPDPPVTSSLSPFNFTNGSGTNGPQAGVQFSFSGVTSDGLSTFNANFTSQFNVPFQTVLSQLGSQGFVSNTYSGTVTVTPLTTTPEPGSTVLMSIGLGLVLVSLQLRRRRI
jgi:PEP-CTERM motif